MTLTLAVGSVSEATTWRRSHCASAAAPSSAHSAHAAVKLRNTDIATTSTPSTTCCKSVHVTRSRPITPALHCRWSSCRGYKAWWGAPSIAMRASNVLLCSSAGYISTAASNSTTLNLARISGQRVTKACNVNSKVLSIKAGAGSQCSYKLVQLLKYTLMCTRWHIHCVVRSVTDSATNAKDVIAPSECRPRHCPSLIKISRHGDKHCRSAGVPVAALQATSLWKA